ncbi:dTDP-4-dehydrorhamnose reductase [Chelatococcus sp. SYSU_G07232]|uniref:dTDP-4-dehydrorhamnose reductase n=1 Tax=Chelatococcus albus TaxID=3047466 RepID=A0ABT7AHH4_9HYPH|nr:dTDP-4-dehydrorhamnose reductase [Chelatococcus sp. SYSU_G07232]MDJ1158803.1 dTDP-4-dehydrorhamnose reductase [Chelatococcus sp. SYSU_G07232]
MSTDTQRPYLIVGRAGQLATDLAAAAAARNLPAVALGRPDLDLTDASSAARVIAALHPRAVVNAAAYTNVDRAESEPELAFALNRDGPARLAMACAAAGIPLVHVSTDMVFDGTKDSAYVETDRTNPLGVYARSKLAGEEAVATALSDHVVVRVSWVFGPSGDNFVKKLLTWARERGELSIVSDQRGRPTYSPGLAAALLTLAERMAAGGPAAPRGLLHLAGASLMTRYEQALAVMEGATARGGPRAAVKPVLTRDFPTPARRPLNAELDPGLAARAHGIRLDRFEADLALTLDRLLGPIPTPGRPAS